MNFENLHPKTSKMLAKYFDDAPDGSGMFMLKPWPPKVFTLAEAVAYCRRLRNRRKAMAWRRRQTGAVQMRKGETH